MKSIIVDTVPDKWVAYYLARWEIPFNPVTMTPIKRSKNCRAKKGYYKLTGAVAYDISKFLSCYVYFTIKLLLTTKPSTMQMLISSSCVQRRRNLEIRNRKSPDSKFLCFNTNKDISTTWIGQTFL